MSEAPREALEKLHAGREAARKPGEVTFVLNGVPTQVQVVWDALDTPDIETLLKASPEDLEKRGISAEQHAKFNEEYEEVRKNLAIAASKTKKGQDPEKVVKRIEEVYPSFLKKLTDFGIEIKPRVRTPKRESSLGAVAPTEANPAPVETPSAAAEQEIVDALKGNPEPVQPSLKRREPVPPRDIEIESSRVHISETPNSFGELNTLDFTPVGLDQVLTEPEGPEKLKARINAGMKAALHGLPKRKSISKEVPAYKPAEQMRHWLAFTVIEMNASTGRVNVDDFKEYSTLLSALDTAVRNLPEETRARLSEKKGTPTEAPVAERALSPEAAETALRDSLLKRLDECRNRADGILSKRGRSQPKDRAMFESMVIQVRESIWRNYSRDNNDIIARGDVKSLEEFLDKWSAEASVETPAVSPESPEGLRARLNESLERVRKATRDAHGGNNPLAVVNIVGTQEFFAGYNSARALLNAQKNGELNGAETTALPTVSKSVAELEQLSFEIAKRVTEKGAAEPTTARKPAPEAVAQAPKINIVVENSKSPERTPELAALKEKYDTYKTAKEAYEKAIDAHYGAYRSNTGPFAERMGRGMRKFFGIGPKHDSLNLLYLAMNDARVDFSQWRVEALDARRKGRVAPGGGHAGALATWNEGLKRREIGRTIRRSSEGFVERQYKALSPTQQSAVDSAMGRNATENAVRKDERNMTYKQVAVGALSGALMVWKAKTAAATMGASLVAGYLGMLAGNTTGNVVEWWKNRKLSKLNDELEQVSKERGNTVDYDSIGDYDETLRNRTRKIIATEESRNTQVKAARIAGAVAAGLAAGTIANEYDIGSKIFGGDVPSPESTSGGTQPIPESQPVPEKTPDKIDGTNPLPGHPEGTIEKAAMSKMVAGDNPWDLVEEKHFSEKFDELTKTERIHVIDSVIDRLRDDPSLKERIFPGYEGTSFLDMQIGQEVNLTAYEKLVDEQLRAAGHTGETLAPLLGTETSAATIPEMESENPEPGEGVEEEGDIFENERPSENIEDRRTPEQAAEQDQAFRNMNAETGVSVADIARERMSLYTTLHDAPKSGGIFSTLFGGSSVSAHEYLEDQPLNKVAELSAQRAEYIEMIAKQNNVDATALQNWANYMKQLAPDIANRPPEMTFGAYVDVVAEELAKHAKQA